MITDGWQWLIEVWEWCSTGWSVMVDNDERRLSTHHTVGFSQRLAAIEKDDQQGGERIIIDAYDWILCDGVSQRNWGSGTQNPPDLITTLEVCMNITSMSTTYICNHVGWSVDTAMVGLINMTELICTLVDDIFATGEGYLTVTKYGKSTDWYDHSWYISTMFLHDSNWFSFQPVVVCGGNLW